MSTVNTSVTSKEAIMQVCREIVAKKGLKALNMRLVADECHIALGTLYNYYAGKDELLLETVGSVWMDIFHMGQKCETYFSFPEYITHIFQCIQEGAGKYPDFFTAHSISIAGAGKNKAESMMEQYFSHMKAGMTEVLRADSAVDGTVFSGDFSEADFVDFVFDNILILLAQGKKDCRTLVRIVCRVLYTKEGGNWQ